MTSTTVYHSLKDKHVFITGGASGIGESIVREFVAQGSKVSFIDINEELGEQLAHELGSLASFQVCDLRDIPSLEQCMKTAVQTYGEIAVLVNNAARDTRYDAEDVTVEIWDDMQAVNIRHVFFACKAVRSGMKRLGGGSIINFTSSSFLKRSPRLSVYGAAKSGIIGMTRVLSRDFGEDGIRVNAILPGWIMTERQKELWFTPEAHDELMSEQSLKQLIEPKEVAYLALFLASDDSKLISAQSYVVDGGWV